MSQARIRSIAWLLLVALVSISFYLLVQGVKDQQREDRKDAAAARISDAKKYESKLDQANEKVSKLGDQVRNLGETPVVSTAAVPAPTLVEQRGLTGDRGPQGLQGLIGIPGAQGSQGPVGVPGASGEKGASGSPGAQGSTGPQGATGERGPQGDTGAKGDTGPQGDPGKDAPTVTGVTCEPQGPLLTPLLFTWMYSDGTSISAMCGA